MASNCAGSSKPRPPHALLGGRLRPFGLLGCIFLLLCYVPSAKKPREHLDTCYLLSRGHPDILQRLVKDRRPKRELGNVLRQQQIRSLDAFYVFAKRQADGGDDRWLSVAYGTQAKRLQEQIAAVWAVETAGRRLEDLSWLRFVFGALCWTLVSKGFMVAGRKCM